MSEIRTGVTPRHVWIVGGLSLVWNAFGAFDYTMTQTKNESYMQAFTPEQLDFFYGLPAWVVACWAIAVWGGLVGSILLLLRKKAAVWLFLASLIGMVVTAVQNFVFSNGLEVMGDAFSLIFTAMIFLISVALFLYSRAMAQRGVLT